MAECLTFAATCGVTHRRRHLGFGHIQWRLTGSVRRMDERCGPAKIAASSGCAARRAATVNELQARAIQKPLEKSNAETQ